MIFEDEIDQRFVQEGPICVLASYGLVIDYYSMRGITTRLLLDNYISHYEELIHIIAEKKKNKKLSIDKIKAAEISRHFHEICIPLNKRGFKFIEGLHKFDCLETERYCKVHSIHADIFTIPDEQKEELKNILREYDRIAMILYRVQGGNHAVITWYNEDEDHFKYRDPEKQTIRNGNIIDRVDITEYLVFEPFADDE